MNTSVFCVCLDQHLVFGTVVSWDHSLLVANLRNGLCHNGLVLFRSMYNVLPCAWMREVDAVCGLLLVESILGNPL